MTAPCSHRWPRIVAESLRAVREPIHTIGRAPVCSTPTDVLAMIHGATTPMRSPETPPSFLYPTQHDPWRRVTHALAHWGGALLAEPVGTGKSWIALAVATRERDPALVLAPAILLSQWKTMARAAGVPIITWSHERLSRGALPPRWPSLVIVDESHRFRSPGIRRVRALAPHLVGRRTLLLTATPIVNRARDMVEQLRLIVSDDALALDGILSLTSLESCGRPPAAVRRLVVRGPTPPMANGRSLTALPRHPAEARRGCQAVHLIDRLVLSQTAAVRQLLRTVLLDAAGSSDAAMHAALARYRALLLHARDAGGVSRRAIRHFAGPGLDQMVFWSLVGGEGESDLEVGDLPIIEAALSSAPDDHPWMTALLTTIDDTVPTVCFARHRATARALRLRLGDTTAWVTGSEAGIGPHRLPRQAVLEAFGPMRENWTVRSRPPRILIATDVAAEGLDLQAAGRIVHIDLPWTAMRLAQREGRLLRLGQHHATVDIVARHPVPCIERALQPAARIRRKHRLAAEWFDVLEQPDRPAANSQLAASVATLHSAQQSSDVVLIALSRGMHAGVLVLARADGGEWTEQQALVTRLLGHAMECPAARLDVEEVREVFASALRAVYAGMAEPAPGMAVLIHRAQRLARAAARRRDATEVARLDRLLAFAAAPQMLGGRMLLDRWRAMSDDQLFRVEIPASEPRPPVAARVLAALLFRSPGAELR
ncbi:MAG: DEAD/DEAH box helicase [Gemmatimonadota bacterium]